MNISTPVTTTLRVAWTPTISTSSPTLTTPRSMRPVATVPRPLMPNTSSTGIRNGLSTGRTGVGDVRVDRVHQLLDRGVGRVVGVVGRLERLERGAADDRDVVTREVVLGQQLADLELDEVEQLGVVDHVDLVEEHHDVRHLDLAGEQDVLAGLGHRAVGGRDDQDRAVHLGGAGDHVLDVVRVPGAVDVGVVAGGGLVLDVGDRDRDPALALLGGVVDRVERAVLGLAACRARYLLIAAVSDVLPWSMWPIVPTLTCGLLRSNFFLAMSCVDSLLLARAGASRPC